MSSKKINKTNEVIKHLRKYGSITSLQAFNKWNATRLSAIIFNLRHKKGFDIDSKEKVTKFGVPFSKYILRGEPDAR
jgi:hypothetical protein